MDAGANHYTIAGAVVPYHYSIYIEPNLKSFRFAGKCTIKLRADGSTNSLRLNAKELAIKSAVIRCGGLEQKAAFTADGSADEVTFKFQKPVSGEAELEIDYTGVHNDRLYGFYRSKYTYRGKSYFMLSTQFEAPNARACFPCLDEPEFKATFDVALLVDRDLEAVSNMPIKQARAMPKGKKLVTFRTSPKMSTYLLYLGVGKFDWMRGSAGQVKLGIGAAPGSRIYERMALEYGKRLLADLQSYFKIKYPLPKLDLLAIPDFAVGAMENWGAITFREAVLLGTEKGTSVAGRQRIAEVMAHEMAHQWFGDLVTMRWWDDMWLNESFATFMDSRCVDRVFPEWKEMLKYYMETVAPALSADGLKNTHPISVRVNTVGEIEELFDTIGYEKGCSILFMLEDFVGPELFRRGLTRYLKAHSYSNATKHDLWGAIQDECKAGKKRLPVVAVMEDWIDREGYPVVSVRRNEDGNFELEQERFTVSGNMRDSLWKIPISYTSDGGDGKLLMEERKTVVKGAGAWIKLNSGQAGFYRVSYEPKDILALGKLVKEKRLGDVDAWGIENDLFAFVRSGERPVSDYLDFVRNFCLECGYPANASISGHLSWLGAVARGEQFLKDVKALDLKFHRKVLDRLGWEVRQGESSTDTQMRSMAIGALGIESEVATVTMTKTLFDAYTEKGDVIDANIRSAVYYTVAFNKPDQEKYSMMLGAYRGESPPDEKVRALQAIGMLGSVQLIEKALDLGASKDVRLQDSIRIAEMVATSNPLGREPYKAWVLKNWKELMQKCDPSSHMLRSYVRALSLLADRESHAQLAAFFGEKQNMRDDIRMEVRQTLERISANIRFIERNSQQRF